MCCQDPTKKNWDNRLFESTPPFYMSFIAEHAERTLGTTAGLLVIWVEVMVRIMVAICAGCGKLTTRWSRVQGC